MNIPIIGTVFMTEAEGETKGMTNIGVFQKSRTYLNKSGNPEKRMCILGLMLVLSLSGIPSVFGQPTSPAVAVGSISKVSAPIASLSYQVTVPSYPSVNSTGGFEFHAGMMNQDNSTFVKGTISYGCQIAAHKPCYPPFKNRFIFYVSVIDVSSQFRTQYPSSGYVITSESDYTVSFQKASCPLKMVGWTFKIANSTASWSDRVCGMNYQFVYPISGMMEIHNITSCLTQLPPSRSFTESDFTIDGSTAPLSWSPIAVNPTVSCNATDIYDGANISVSW